MAKKSYRIMVSVAILGLILAAAGCASSKMVKEQKIQLDQANSKISELQENNNTLNKDLIDTKSALDNAQNEKQQLLGTASTLESQIKELESQKAELEIAIKGGKESEAKSQKRMVSLNSQINALKKEMDANNALIVSKDNEISLLQNEQSAFKDQVANQNQQISTLVDEKSTLSEQMKKNISSKNRLITILAVLLGIAIVLMIIGFTRRRKRV